MNNILKSSLAILFTGLVIKLMDDYLDQELDKLNNRSTLAQNLGRGILPYALILFSIAMFCDYQLSVSLLWASYIVGMGVNKNQLPTGLKSYQEFLLLLILGFSILDSQVFLFSLLIILFIQTADDYIDYYRERYISKDNFINYLGRSGTVFIIIFSLVASLNLNWQLALLVMAFSVLIATLLGKKIE